MASMWEKMTPESDFLPVNQIQDPGVNPYLTNMGDTSNRMMGQQSSLNSMYDSLQTKGANANQGVDYPAYPNQYNLGSPMQSKSNSPQTPQNQLFTPWSLTGEANAR